MKLMHLSDLHIGIRINEYSMCPDQQYILAQIIDIANEEQPDAVIIAGDVYDKAVPSAEAVTLFDRFLTCLAEKGLPVFIISGNHDSPERLSFGTRLMSGSGIHIAPVFSGEVESVRLADGFGAVRIWLLPFIKPAAVRLFFPDREIATYNDAVAAVLDSVSLNTAERNVLVCHQFITGAVTSESEQVTAGGIDNVDVSLFDRFDYVALGHIHRPQRIKRDTVRYCGTPLKYSFSEASQQKSVTFVTLGEKGEVAVTERPLTPMRDMREIRGSYEELTLRESYAGTNTDDYVRVILTDEEDIPDAVGKLRTIYPHIMRLDYDNRRTRSSAVIAGAENAEEKSPLTLFGELYELQNGCKMTDAQLQLVGKMIDEIWEGEK